jgi:hypothetical protein
LIILFEPGGVVGLSNKLMRLFARERKS